VLPDPTDPAFPDALLSARTAKGLSRTDLARLSQIHPVMIRRYEEKASKDFARPTQKTCGYLNRALGFAPPLASQPANTSPAAKPEGSTTDRIPQVLDLMRQLLSVSGAVVTFTVTLSGTDDRTVPST
jgi:transcriptional regulator with XRE-family HTH domain